MLIEKFLYFIWFESKKLLSPKFMSEWLRKL